MTTKDKIKEELERIRVESGGKIHPQAVVEFARNKNTALHSRFEWDDGKAAEAFRLVQARQIIRIHVEVAPDDVSQVRAYVSLPSDRETGGGYRSTNDVMSDDEKRAELLEQALREFKNFRRKYAALNEFAKVFAAAETVEPPKKSRRRRAG